MANLDYLEHSIPVAPLKICALAGCEGLAQTIDQYLVQFRRDLLQRNPEKVGIYGYSGRSEERRVGKECRSRWSPYH